MSPYPVHLSTNTSPAKLRAGSRLGKYRLDCRIGRGAFADVFAATDTLLSIKVALKIPSAKFVSDELLNEFRREAKLTMTLDHPNILPTRDASFIDGHFVIVTPLAERTLDDRIKKRIRFETAFDFTSQLLSAVAHAPRGAWPLSLANRYIEDRAHIHEYARLARSDEGFARYLSEHVFAAGVAA